MPLTIKKGQKRPAKKAASKRKAAKKSKSPFIESFRINQKTAFKRRSLRIRPIPPWQMMPSEREVRLMIDVILAEPLLIGSKLVCRSAGHCAMGALLVAVGFDDDELRDMNDGLDAGGVPPEVWERLYDAYRIDADDASTIMGANDGSFNPDRSKSITYEVEGEDGPSEVTVRHPRNKAALVSAKQQVVDAIIGIGQDVRPRTTPDMAAVGKRYVESY